MNSSSVRRESQVSSNLTILLLGLNAPDLEDQSHQFQSFWKLCASCNVQLQLLQMQLINL